MIVPLLCFFGICLFAEDNNGAQQRSGTRMRNMRFSHTNGMGERVFVPTVHGLDLIARGQVNDVVCPTGETCKHACACSGVSASGIVGVGASCKCITLQQPPNPAGRSNDRLTIPPRPSSTFDAALRYAIGAGYNAPQTLAYVCSKCAPNEAPNARTARVFRERIEKRLQSPQFVQRCKVGCR